MDTDIDSEARTAPETAVEFVDCNRVRITGDYEDVLCGVTFGEGDGQTGTVVDSVGGVEDDRTIDAAAALDLPAETAVLQYVELFETDPGTPGLGDERVENPALEDCYAERLGDDARAGGADPIEFVDCETVRVTASAETALLSLFWWDEAGRIGTIAEPVGGVDGTDGGRTISAREAFGDVAYGPVVTDVELFDADTPVVPGGGTVVLSNPDVESCTEAIREAYDGPGELETIDAAR